MTLLRSDQVVRGKVDWSRATAGCAATRAAAGRRGNAAWRVRAAAVRPRGNVARLRGVRSNHS